jgi:cardiolipin synthase
MKSPSGEQVLEEDDYETELIIDGEDARTEILLSIHEAKKSIRVRMFMWRDDSAGNMILRALEKKAEIFPDIQIYIEKDSFGTLVYNLQNIVTFGRKKGDIFSTVKGKTFLKTHPNISLKYVGSWIPLSVRYVENNDHSKVFVFDEDTENVHALVGGMNMSDEYLSAKEKNSPELGWHDYMVKIRWELANKILFKRKKQYKKWLRRAIRQGIEILSTLRHRFTMRQQIIRELSQAKRSIIVEHGYLTDRSVIKVLRQLNRSGIMVQVILPDFSDGAWHSNMESAHKLLKPSFTHPSYKNTIEVFLYPGMIHAKAILIDESTAIIGSANLTYGSFDHLNETNVILRKKNRAVEQLREQFQKDIALSKRLTPTTIPRYFLILAWLQRNLI